MDVDLLAQSLLEDLLFAYIQVLAVALFQIRSGSYDHDTKEAQARNPVTPCAHLH